MASTNKTTHYDLPQWIGTDKPTFLGDLNGAFATIDTQLYTAVTNAENANTNASSAAGAVSNMQNDVNGLKTWQTTATSAISGLQNSVTGLTPVIASPQNMFVSLGSLLSSYSPVLQSNEVNERLITIGALKLLNIYGGIAFTYTGTPASANLTDNLNLINWSNLYSKYGIAQARSFTSIGIMTYQTSETQPSIPIALFNDGSNTKISASNWSTGTLTSGGTVRIEFQALLVLN